MSRTTWPEQAARHARERRKMVMGALERCGWQLSPAARELEVPEYRLRVYVEGDEVLGPLYAERKPGRGRPRKVLPDHVK